MAEVEMKHCWPNNRHIYDSKKHKECPFCKADRDTSEPVRNLEQNKRLWAMLTDVSNQTDWPVNGRMGKLSKEDWKDIFTAELRKEQRIAQGISGGFVLLGAHTYTMKKREMADLIELMFAFGAEHGIAWTDPTAIPLEAYV